MAVAILATVSTDVATIFGAVVAGMAGDCTTVVVTPITPSKIPKIFSSTTLFYHKASLRPLLFFVSITFRLWGGSSLKVVLIYN